MATLTFVCLMSVVCCQEDRAGAAQAGAAEPGRRGGGSGGSDQSPLPGHVTQVLNISLAGGLKSCVLSSAECSSKVITKSLLIFAKLKTGSFVVNLLISLF